MIIVRQVVNHISNSGLRVVSPYKPGKQSKNVVRLNAEITSKFEYHFRYGTAI